MNAEKYREMFTNKIILAPMVRIGTLPMRLLALEYGADLVYTEELVDLKLLRTIRKVNDALGTVDFVDKTDGTIVFRTCEREKEKVILQVGTCDPERAVQVAKLIENDVAGIDVNMGCPKEFSIKGGMGAALLSNPENATNILRQLVAATKIPVTCKIRVFADSSRTIKLCKQFQDCGIAAIAVHGRTVSERQQHPNRNDLLRDIAKELAIPVIANGGSRKINSYEDIIKFKEMTGCSSVMVARAAEWNVSIFRREGKLALDDIIRTYIKLAIDYDNQASNSKYCVQNMLRELQESELGKKFLETQTLSQISELWNLGGYYQKIMERHRERGLLSRRDVRPLSYKKENDSDSNIIEMEAAFLRGLYKKDPDLPKTKLLSWTLVNGLRTPKYKTQNADKLFKAVVTVKGRQYSSSYWEKSKRWAEQGAAIVCLCSLGLYNEDDLRRDGVIR